PATYLAWLASINGVMYAAMVALFLRLRRREATTATTAERQLWTLVVGFIAAWILIGLTDRAAATPERPHQPLALYPRFAILSGLTCAVLGSSYWGAFFAFAAAFWLLALLLPWAPDAGPVGFGLLWTAALVAAGRRLRRLGACADPTPG